MRSERSNTELVELWRAALEPVVLRHASGATPRIAIGHRSHDTWPQLHLTVENIPCTLRPTQMRPSLSISCVKLTFWPGPTLARLWLACAWAGYAQHEALEMVTLAPEPDEASVTGELVYLSKILDPHRNQWWDENVITVIGNAAYPHDRGVREGLPDELTPTTLIYALAVVMPLGAANKLAQHYAHEGDWS